MKTVRFILGAALAVSLISPSVFARGRTPGSVLVFPVQDSTNAITGICVTNTNLSPVDGDTNVHYEYANVVENPNNPFKPYNCIVFDRVEYLTPADTLCVVTDCHNAGSQKGYLVVSAEDPDLFDTPWKFDYLVGTEVVLNGSGGIYGLNAISLKAGDALADKAATDADGDGQLDFDGTEYEETPDKLILSSFIAAADSQLALINLTGGPLASNTVLIRAWNDWEFPLSATVIFCCWFNEKLKVVNPLFDEFFLRNNTPNSPFEMDFNCDNDDDAETGWAVIDSILVQESGGGIIEADGALLGALTAGGQTFVDYGVLLWESDETQDNGAFVDFGI
jgi:hypothetical protein